MVTLKARDRIVLLTKRPFKAVNSVQPSQVTCPSALFTGHRFLNRKVGGDESAETREPSPRGIHGTGSERSGSACAAKSCVAELRCEQVTPAESDFPMVFRIACEFHENHQETHLLEEVLRWGIVLKDAIATTLALLQ
eukprot:s601_g11.t1